MELFSIQASKVTVVQKYALNSFEARWKKGGTTKVIRPQQNESWRDTIRGVHRQRRAIADEDVDVLKKYTGARWITHIIPIERDLVIPPPSHHAETQANIGRESAKGRDGGNI
jgi:hypothetical protein